MIFVNYKTFEQGSGEKAIELTRILEEVAKETQIKIIPVVQIIDAEKIVSATTLEVWVQHIDPITYGAHTGSVLPEEIAKIGVVGTFLNHSEHKFEKFDDLYAANEKAMSANLKTLIFSGNLDELAKISELAPTYVSYEPPELIGSTKTSVARSQPEIISKAVEVAEGKGEPLIVGAGVSTREDVKKSLELGAVGVAVATAVVKSEDPRNSLLQLTEGFK